MTCFGFQEWRMQVMSVPVCQCASHASALNDWRH